MKSIIFGLCALVVMTTACKKEDSTPAISKERMVGNYTWVSVTAKVGNMPEQDVMASYMEECQKDDVLSLKNDNTYSVTDAGVKCATAPDGGDWALKGTTIFTMDGEDFTIVSFDGKTLKLTQTDNSMGQPVVLNVTIRKS